MKEGMTREQSAILRGIAILMMIYHHVFATPEIYELEYFSVLQFGGVNVERYVAWFFKIALGIYLFVSGYGMYYVLKKRPVKDPAEESFAGYLFGCYRQSVAKLGRLYAQYWYALVVSMALVFLFDPDAPVFSLKEFLLNMLGVSNSYNATWWYILQYVKMLLLLPLVAALFHRFSNPQQERKKWIFYALTAVAALMCLLAGRFWLPELMDLIIRAAHGLRISFTLIFIVGYLMARFGVYQRISRLKIFEAGKPGRKVFERGAAGAGVSGGRTVSERKVSGAGASGGKTVSEREAFGAGVSGGRKVSEREASGAGVSGGKMLFAGVAALAVSVVVRVLLSDDPAYAKMDFLIVPVFIFGVLTVLERLPRLSSVLHMFGGLSTYMWLVHIFFWRGVFRPLVIFTGVSTGIFLTLVALSAGAAALLKAGEKLATRIRLKFE